MSGARQHPYPALDGVRVIAALSVLFYHLPLMRHPALFQNGMGVDVFFLLSGFVVASAYDDRLASGGWGPGKFLLVRAIRLWPMMALGVALGLVQSLAWPIPVKDLPLDFGGRLACAGFGLLVLPCPLSPTGIMYPTNPPEWSLLYEVLGHVVFALAFAPLLRMRSLLAVICGAGCLFAMGIWRYRGFYFGDTFHAVPFELGRIGFCFFTGVLVRRTRALWTARLSSLPAPLAYALVLALLAAPPPAVMKGGIELFLGLVATPAVVVLAAGARAQGRIGDISMRLALIAYPLYAVHLPIIILTHNLAAGWGMAPAPEKGLAVGLAVALAMVLPSVYDVPFRRWLASILQAPRKGLTSAAGGPI